MVTIPYFEIGIVGSLLLAGAFLPQCYRLLNTKSAKDHLVLLSAGPLGWARSA